ncbi:helix-turn-helix transcriptional regulator [Pukyongiella litopenaei]|uniref:Helix-turn-helix transcriptional regulator n=1 Tax=Pukyongiella litopenaei TaxID=2605946 RepID=A0A5C2H1Q7_9RHOB|nr:AraC family transcriptional regulator [Pukyongiella litopenaei]QEP30388.1 helix-turn-helix transcriptional regulator [Pukyongiella litopenaei]
MNHQTREYGAVWTVLPTRHIEALRDAVVGAGLDAVQMSKGTLGGSLAFTEHRGAAFTSGLMGGRVSLSGPLSSDLITFGLGLRVAAGTWHWQREISKGCVGIFHPGDEHDSLYTPGSFYVTASLDLETLTGMASRLELVVDRSTLGGTGFHDRLIAARWIDGIAARMHRVHDGSVSVDETLCDQILHAVLTAYTRAPRPVGGRSGAERHARIFAIARDYIHAHLAEPLAIDDIAREAGTTPRTLNRAFLSVVEDTPYNFIQMLRLNLVRRELLSGSVSPQPIYAMANRWGLREAGRFSGLYRDLFDELPSETRNSAKRLS